MPLSALSPLLSYSPWSSSANASWTSLFSLQNPPFSLSLTHSRDWIDTINPRTIASLIVNLTTFSLLGSHVQLRDVVPRRQVLYVGGRYTNLTDNVTNSPTTVITGQMYVERLSPDPEPENPPLPIIFIAGAAQTGANFLDTPDGRPGWASYFIAKGHTVYLSDQPARGRSFWSPGEGSIGYIGPPGSVSDIFTDVANNGNQWPQAKLHTQWPGTGRMGDPTFDAFYSSQVQFQTDRFISEEQNAQAYAALVDLVGDCYIISHSQAGAYGWRVGDMRPHRVKGIVQLEPSGPPFTLRPPFGSGPAFAFGLTDLTIQYEPSAGKGAENMETTTEPAIDNEHNECIMQKNPAKQLVNLGKIPELVVTGEASFHAPYDYCTVKYLRQVGVDVEHADLGSEGIHGNGHMLFMEKNNLEIADRVYKWLEKHS